ncbi:MAG TPA: ATP-binding protein [Ktedonobacteraceae bacterium]|nr:ATP-binding protein [Ktedonobacteraceae bacterium]
MNWRSLARIRYRGNARISQEAGAALFQGLRIRLTLWYCAVMGAALVLFGVALYIGTQYFLLNPIASDAAAHAQVHQNEWFMGSPGRACPLLGPTRQPGPPPGQGFQVPEQVVCFDQNGSLLPDQNTAGLSSAFLTNTLVKTALQTGQPADDMVNAGGTIGQIYRYALVVPNPGENGSAGVVLIGESVRAQESALSLLLTLLLSIGGVALLGAALGGLFLSNRALAPARLAWTNQQRFIADASHELRTPLTLLRADAEVLLRGRERLETEDAALLKDIVAEAGQMARISDNMLTLARLDNNALHREHEVVSMAELAQEGAQRIHALAEQRDITVQMENIGMPYVIGDPTLLEQAVLILLDNAIKYNRSGGRVMVHTEAKDEQAILEVRDNGIGIAAEHLLHLGERFYRVDKARSREAGGTGLGLSIARSIIIAHGGRLSLSSVLEQGTTVTLTLPLASGTLLEDREEETGNTLPEQTV